MRKQISNYRGELPRQEFLRQQVVAIMSDTRVLPWMEYPCLTWPFSSPNSRRAVITINNKSVSITLASYRVAYGSVPLNHTIEHYCSNQLCFHPRHLFADPDRLFFLETVLANLKYDLALPWQAYPCLEWPYVRHLQHRYGLISFGGKWKRVTRLSFEKTRRVELGSQFALHHCDNPPCFHPAHLFSGSYEENNADMMAKGRYRNGPNQVQKPDPQWFSKWTVLRQQPLA